MSDKFAYNDSFSDNLRTYGSTYIKKSNSSNPLSIAKPYNEDCFLPSNSFCSGKTRRNNVHLKMPSSFLHKRENASTELCCLVIHVFRHSSARRIFYLLFLSFYRCLAIADGSWFHNKISIFELATAAICDLGGPGLLEAVNLFVKRWQGF